MAGDGVDRQEPGQQRKLAAVKDRAGRNGCLTATGGTFVSERLGIERPSFGALAFRTNKTIWPALFIEVAGAGRVIRKPRGKGGSGHGAVGFPAACHENIIGTRGRFVKAANRYL